MKLQKRFITAKLLRKFENGIEIDEYDSLQLTNDDDIELKKNGAVVAVVEDYWSVIHLENAFEINSIIECCISAKNGRNLKIEVKLEPKLINKINVNSDGIAGIYAIECEDNKLTYVGQSSNIKTRFDDHFNDLSIGFHHNVDLQHTWINNQNSIFNFKLLEAFPTKYQGNIEDRKWLELNEIKWIEHYNRLELCLNRTKGEFVDTRKTLIEQGKIDSEKKRVNDLKNKINDDAIKATKKIIKAKILELEEIIEIENERLEPLKNEIKELDNWIIENTKFFSFMESSVVKKNKEIKIKEKSNLSKLLDVEVTKLREIYKEIETLETDYRLLRTSKQKKLRVYS